MVQTMASNTLPEEPTTFGFDTPYEKPFGETVSKLLMPLASLKLTVALFAMAIFLIFAGTLAQVERDIWEVMRLYFRTFLARIELQIFFPASFFPNRPQVGGAFYFPGGWLIGGGLMINLLAAHSLRFKFQARGMRLAAGLGVMALGTLLTVLVVLSGDNKDGVQDMPWVSWSAVWQMSKMGLVVLLAAMFFALFKLDSSRRVERAVLFGLILAVSAGLGWSLYLGDAALSESSLRILWQLMKGTLAGVVLLAGCVLAFRKRAGIVLLHAGIGLMMANELVVHLFHEEGQMHIKEGQTINFVQDIRELELAVVDRSAGEKEDQMTVVPQSILVGGKPIRHAELPFDIEVLQYFQNSDLRRVQPGDKNPATAGNGLQWIAEPARAGTGTDSGGEIDLSAAYVKFSDKESKKPLGTHLVGVTLALQDVAEQVTVDGKPYEVFLRFKRTYKPYSMALRDVRFDKYMGTNTPKNYSSELRLVDPSRNVDREVKIWMNNPLRYAGETFYQSSFNTDPSTGGEITGLQVVTNTGWMIPYVACMLVATGMLAHFSIVLVRFLSRRAAGEPALAKARNDKSRKPRAAEEQKRGMGVWLVPLATVLVFAMFISSLARTPKTPDGEMKLHEFGTLPVVYQGRIKPFDTLARNSLRIVSDKETFVDSEGKRQPAIRWLLDVIARPSEAAKHKVVRIENLEVLNVLGLEQRSGFRYAVEEFQNNMEKFEDQSRRAREKEAAELSQYDQKILELDQRLRLYTVLLAAFDQPRIRADREHAARDLMAVIQHQQQTLSRMDLPLAVPPAPADREADGEEVPDWEPYARAYVKAWAQANVMNQEPNPATLAMNSMLVSYARQDVSDFNDSLAEYQAALAATPPPNLRQSKVNFEAFFNHFAPFIYSAWLYVFAFVLTALSWLFWTRPLNRAAFWLIVCTLCVHTFALVARMYISDRWLVMVTNLYSSAIFIGWASVVLGVVLEVLYRLGIGNVIAAVGGFATLLIAHFLSADGDTFTVMQAVLDTNFWLATHVTCITLGYATTYVAGLLGLIYILAGMCTPYLSRFGKELARMTYGTLCFAIFFSFVGTVLGGLWADDSWGRFWGWDPKENGALIIVLWNALVLHARWGGMVKDRGLAVLAVAGNIATSWSWFGVNQLGAGLHSYGFTEGVALALFLFVASQLALIGLGSLPKHTWWSFRDRPAEA